MEVLEVGAGNLYLSSQTSSYSSKRSSQISGMTRMAHLASRSSKVMRARNRPSLAAICLACHSFCNGNKCLNFAHANLAMRCINTSIGFFLSRSQNDVAFSVAIFSAAKPSAGGEEYVKEVPHCRWCFKFELGAGGDLVCAVEERVDGEECPTFSC